jgi:hypothetical protein
MKGTPTEKTRWACKAAAHRFHGELKGFALNLKDNGLDDKPALEAAKALAKLAAEVEARNVIERAAKQAYRDSFNVTHVASTEDIDKLRRENEELKARLALQPNR